MEHRPAQIFRIALLALTIASCTSAEYDVTGVEPVTGTLRVDVISPGFSDPMIHVVLSGPEGFLPRTAAMSLGGTATFSGLEPGAYTVGTTLAGFDCPSVSASVLGNQTTQASIACTRKTFIATGSVTGIVMGGDAPVGGASVSLAASGFLVTRHTAPSGRLSFLHIPAGEYTLTVSHMHFTCPTRTIVVAPPEIASVDVTCDPKATGALAGFVILGGDPGSLVGGVTVDLTGPTTATLWSTGGFEFLELQPGTYTATATAFGLNCQTLEVEVQAARTTTVEIRCGSRPPTGNELASGWEYYRFPLSQTGTCPAILPPQASGSMTFHPGTRTIGIVGLDPQLAIVGIYDEESGVFAGSGVAVLADGSTIQSDLTATFYWDVWDFGGPLFSTDGIPPRLWTRRHRDAGGNLVCTEVYAPSGYAFY